MSLKSKVLRITLIAFLVLAFAGYFAFTTFLFNPLQGGLKVDTAALVPRDVDFFVARAKLQAAFSTFPRLEVQDALDKNAGWKTWITSPEYADLDKEWGIETSLAELRKAVAQLPLGIEPQDAFGGEDMVVAGYFKGTSLAEADWAVYGTANWAGKLASSVLRHPSWIGLEEQGIKATVHERYVELSGGQLPRTLFVTRVKNVVIASTRADLASAAHDLDARAYTDSFFQSAVYFDHIQNARRNNERDEFEVFVNTRKLFDTLSLPKPWPNPSSQDFLPALLGRLFQVHAIKSLVGVAQVDEGLAVDVHGEFSSELVSPEQQKLYRTRGFEQDELLKEASRLAPADTAVFAYLRSGVGDLLRMMTASAEKALVQNFEDLALRPTGKYRDIEAWITELDGALKDRAVLIVRPNDYPPDPEGPRHNDVPVPAIALVLWPKSVDVILAQREMFGVLGAKIGLEGRKPNEPGYYRNIEAGFETREYWSQAIDGTGVIVTCNANDMTIISNSLGMMGHMLATALEGGNRYPPLADDPTFGALVRSSLPNGNAFVWSNPRTLAPILRARAREVAEASIAIDWKAERTRLEDKILREQFPGTRRGQATAEIQAKVEAEIDREIDLMAGRIKSEQVPALMAKQERTIAYLEQCSAMMLMLALNPKSFELSLRVVAPLPRE